MLFLISAPKNITRNIVILSARIFKTAVRLDASLDQTLFYNRFRFQKEKMR